jgi:histone-lysine N-methyltransferase SETMAR
MDVRMKQRAVIEFLVLEKETVGNIHKRLQNVYGNSAVDRSTVGRWVKRTSEEHGHADLDDQSRSGRPQTAMTEDTIDRANNLIQSDRRMTVAELSMQLEIGEASVCRILNKLGYSKVCARWVPRQLTDGHKERRKAICSELVARFDADGDEFLGRIVTGDETWLHHFDPETKRQSMEWHHTTSPRKKKFKVVASAGKVMATVFWDMHGVILVDIMPTGATINSESYVRTLQKLQKRLRRIRPTRAMQDVLLQHDNARPHSSLRTMEVITKFGWTVVPHPAYSPDLAPSDYHLFGKLKDGLRGTHFPDDESLVTAAKQWLKDAGGEFYRAGIQALVPRWRKAVELNGDYVEK